MPFTMLYKLSEQLRLPLINCKCLQVNTRFFSLLLLLVIALVQYMLCLRSTYKQMPGIKLLVWVCPCVNPSFLITEGLPCSSLTGSVNLWQKVDLETLWIFSCSRSRNSILRIQTVPPVPLAILTGLHSLLTGVGRGQFELAGPYTKPLQDKH